MRKQNRLYIIAIILFLILVLFFTKKKTTPIDPEVLQTLNPHPAIQQVDTTPVASSPNVIVSSTSAPVNTNSKVTWSLTIEKVQQVRSSMKVSLAAIYAAQMAYQSEYEGYSSDLNAIGFRIDDGPQDFKVGFPESNSDMILGKSTYTDLAKNINFQDLLRHCLHGCTSSKDQFEVIVASNLDADDDLEVWVINERKEMIQVIDDLK